MSRMSMRSSSSTYRPPSAAGTELDWESLAVTASSMGAPGVATIREEEEEQEAGPADATGDGSMFETGGSSSLPPIRAATPAGSETSSLPFNPDMLNPAEKAQLAKEYLAKKAGQDWLTVHGPDPQRIFKQAYQSTRTTFKYALRSGSGAQKPEDQYLETVRLGLPCRQRRTHNERKHGNAAATAIRGD